MKAENVFAVLVIIALAVALLLKDRKLNEYKNAVVDYRLIMCEECEEWEVVKALAEKLPPNKEADSLIQLVRRHMDCEFLDSIASYNRLPDTALLRSILIDNYELFRKKTHQNESDQ